jgi:transposase-like protein
MEEWDPATNDFVLRCNSCWRTNKNKRTKIIRTSREKYYCEQCLSMYDNLCHC